MPVGLTIAWLVVFASSLYGWGRGCGRVIGLAPVSVPVTIALGLSLVVVLGGVCNLLAVAAPPTLWSIVGAGLLLALVTRRAPHAEPPRRLPTTVSVVVVFVTLGFVCATLVPPLAFNYHDDYQKYFTHPVRMLQTGSMYGGTLSALGFETLGGQAWLHGFAASVGGVESLNAIDLGLCFALCIALVGVGPAGSSRLIFARLLGVLAVLVINPQIVNVSATYSGAALLLALVGLLAPDAQRVDEPGRAQAIACGLVMAALCALKTSFVLSSALLGGVVTLAIYAHSRSLSRTLAWSSVCAGSALLGVLPWLLVHARSFAALRTHEPSAAIAVLSSEALELFSSAPVLYGEESFGTYTFVTSCALVSGACAWFSSPRSGAGRPWLAHAAVATALTLALTYLVMLGVVAPRSQGLLVLMRLLAPSFIGLLPALIVVSARAVAPRPRAFAFAPLVLALLVLAALRTTLPVRAAQAITHGSVLAFPGLARDPDYIRYNQDVLHGSMRAHMQKAQASIPRGAAFIAWTNSPFLLDFQRNEISELEPAGLATPWATLPEVAYVMWELNGYATTQLRGFHTERGMPTPLRADIGYRSTRLVHVLIALARESKRLYADGQVLVLQLASPSVLSQRYRASLLVPDDALPR
jgi:hypothetical protein